MVAGAKPLAIIERTGNERAGFAQPYVAATELRRACVWSSVVSRPQLRLADDAGRLGAEGHELHRLVLGDKAVETLVRSGKAGGKLIDRQACDRAGCRSRLRSPVTKCGCTLTALRKCGPGSI